MKKTCLDKDKGKLSVYVYLYLKTIFIANVKRACNYIFIMLFYYFKFISIQKPG